MAKKAKIWLLIILATIILAYYLSPPRNLTIQIDAKPQGVEEFYVEITSSRANLHGSTVKRVAKQLVPANQKTNIFLNQKNILWFGKLAAKIHHPEYFWKVEGANNNYFLPKLKMTPIAWADALANSPRWEIQTPSYENRTDQYIAASHTHRIINMSHVHYHLNSMNNGFLDLFLQNVDATKLRKSIAVFDLIVKEFDDGMLEESIATFGPTEFVQKHIDETHAALAEIHEKFN
ncbi:MAG: hypothetical protein AB8B92_04825 [Gammaproteobacteria bacterium]